MKIRGIITFLVLFIIVLPSYAGAATLGELRLSLIYGDVQIMTEDTSEWVPAAINMPLRAGDRIWVPEGARTEVQARNGTAIRLDERSSLDILTVDNDSLQFYLDIGRAYLNFRGPKRSRITQLETPDSSVQVYDRAKFAVAVSERGGTDISVFKGRVYAESRSGRTKVGAGKVLYVTADYAELYPLGTPDAWEEWNMDRDRIFEERGPSSRYLPDDLDIYSSDLDSNGRWVNTSQYGYVWTPTVHVYAGWSPYRDGRWVWIGGDYVWVAYEPWGWVPYHYGRWSFIASLGWCWVPPVRGDVYWGPGYVGWVSTPTYVAWVPLAPEEVYYGFGHYGRHSVNIVNVNINTIEVKNVYRNTRVNNGITVVPREAFLTGNRVDFKVRDNPFMKEKISIGRPRIEPQRATRIPVIRDVPKAKEPPRKVRETRVPELKKERRLVREPGRSVFTPGKTVRTMPVKDMKNPRTGGVGRAPEPREKDDKRGMQKMETRQPDRAAPVRGKDLQAPAEKKPVKPKDATPPPAINKKERQQAPPALDKGRQPRGDEGRTDKKQREIKPPEKEKRQAPPEKSVVQPKDTTPPSAINKKERQQAPPALDKGRQSRGDEGRPDKKQRETKTSEKEKRQAPPEKRVVRPKDTTPPPAIDKKGRQPEQPVAGSEKQPRKVEEKAGQANKRTGAPAAKGPSEKKDSGVKKQGKKKPSLTQEEEEAQNLKVPERKGR